MVVREATASDVEGWAELRVELWPEASLEEHREEVVAMFARPAGERVAFVAASEGTNIRAFAEAALRHDYVNGCETSPVAFLEGIYVGPEHQGSGIGRQLSAAIESWARERGCRELASDALLTNAASHAFHEAIGFAETERVVYFRKLL